MIELINETVDEKIVNIPWTGPILPMGGIYGPILQRRMTVHEISTLLQKKYPVREILNDGTEVKLTMANYDQDLNGDGGAAAREVKQPNLDIKNVPTKEEREEAELEAQIAREEKEAAEKKAAEEAAKVVTTTPVQATPVQDNNNQKNNNGKNGKKNRPMVDDLTAKK